MNSFPRDVWNRMVSFLGLGHMIQCSRTCHDFRTLILSHPLYLQYLDMTITKEKAYCEEYTVDRLFQVIVETGDSLLYSWRLSKSFRSATAEENFATLMTAVRWCGGMKKDIIQLLRECHFAKQDAHLLMAAASRCGRLDVIHAIQCEMTITSISQAALGGQEEVLQNQLISLLKHKEWLFYVTPLPSDTLLNCMSNAVSSKKLSVLQQIVDHLSPLLQQLPGAATTQQQQNGNNNHNHNHNRPYRLLKAEATALLLDKLGGDPRYDIVRYLCEEYHRYDCVLHPSVVVAWLLVTAATEEEEEEDLTSILRWDWVDAYLQRWRQRDEGMFWEDVISSICSCSGWHRTKVDSLDRVLLFCFEKMSHHPHRFSHMPLRWWFQYLYYGLDKMKIGMSSSCTFPKWSLFERIGNMIGWRNMTAKVRISNSILDLLQFSFRHYMLQPRQPSLEEMNGLVSPLLQSSNQVKQLWKLLQENPSRKQKVALSLFSLEEEEQVIKFLSRLQSIIQEQQQQQHDWRNKVLQECYSPNHHKRKHPSKEESLCATKRMK